MAKQLTRTAVRVYGALSALGNGTGSVMESLLPFFAPILQRHTGEKLNPHSLSAEIRDAYKWNFNADLVEAFVPLLEKHAWLRADLVHQHGTTYTITIDLNEDETLNQSHIANELRDIAKKFKEFSEALTPLTTIPRDVEEFEDILVEWLLYVEAFSEKNIEFRDVFRKDEGGKIVKNIEIPRTTTLRDEEHFLCARFVQQMIKQDSGSSEILAKIASIGLLTEVVQDFISPSTSVERTNLVVYVDAPVAMELIGVSGTDAKNNIEPIIRELIRMGAAVRIFGQSIEEIKQALIAVLRNPRPTGPTAQALARREVLKEYVVSASQAPEKLLQEFGVQPTYRTLEQTPSEHRYFDTEDREELFSKLRYAENLHAREHDADITTLTVRQRSGRTSSDLFQSHAVILTRNGLLAQIVRKQFQEMQNGASNFVPPVVHRRAFATAMWLRTGMGARDLNIPKRMLLSSCERVLAIRPGVVNAVKRLTDAMEDESTARQLDLLISQDRSAQALMDKTLGLANVVTEENFPLLWQEMLQPHLEEEREKGKAAVAAERGAARKKIEEERRKLKKFEEDRNTERKILEEKIASLREDDRMAVKGLCDDVTRIMYRNKMIRIVFGISIAVFFSVPLLLESSIAVRLISFSFGVIMAFLTATGGRMVSTATSASKARKILKDVAGKRYLDAKLSQFEIVWNGRIFEISDLPTVPQSASREDLFIYDS
ncbi:hypothetical protein [Oryzibacter oryziterrae]|uniref:hypothetical protein n=1 Tax=Oryzibacter oryziterrae TaxID=2766474 RepID=UPI001F37FE26|nr:hypothetical protein [Oryzibacter oryziterrae]